MRANAVLIRGVYDDAFLYRDWLITLTSEKTIRVIRVRDIINRINEISPHTRLCNEFLFAHSDWQSVNIFSLFMKDPVIGSHTCSLMDDFPRPFLEISLTGIWHKDFEISVPFSHVLGLYVYAWRVYLALDTGLYHWDFNWLASEPHPFGHIQKRLDTACFNVSARYGAVAASCDDAGLFVGVEVFGDHQNQNIQLHSVSDHSIRSQWMLSDIVNYQNHNSPSLIVTHFENRSDIYGREHERKKIVSFDRDESDLTDIIGERNGHLELDGREIVFVNNSSRHFLLQDVHNDLYIIALDGVSEHRPTRSRVSRYGGVEARVVEASFSQFGTLLETDFSLLVMRGGRLYELVDVEVSSARAFGGARRYRNIVAAIREEGIQLVGILDDSRLGVGPTASSLRKLASRRQDLSFRT